MLKLTALVALTTLSITACKKDEAKSAPPSSTETTAAKPADPAPAAPAAAKPATLEAIKLDAAGADFKGFTIQGPAGGADVTENGTGGAIVNFKDNTLVQFLPADAMDQKEFKKALALNAKTVTYTVDTAEDLSFVTETDMGGTIFKGYGFSVVVAAGPKKFTCGSTYDDQATADRLKAVCKSLAKS